MNERKYFILAAVLKSYIESAEPIGSRTLQRKFNMDISAATIRNEMSDLEHLGFLMKAHTSSGRIPSEQAYRWYVDEILSQGLGNSGILALPDKSLLNQSVELDTMINSALEILSETTNYASIALVSGRINDSLKSLHLIHVSPREIALVMIYDSRAIKTDLIYLITNYSEERVARTEAILQEIFQGRSLVEIDQFLHSHFFPDTMGRANLLKEIIPVIQEQIRSNIRPELRYKGYGYFYEMDDYGDIESTANFIEDLEDNDDLIQLLSRIDSRDNIEVYIGEENGVDFLKDSSIVVAPYHVNDDLSGKIGVIGPTRMEYQKVLRDVGLIAKYIDSVALRI